MGCGKMSEFIDIVESKSIKDNEGFVKEEHTILASVRAYKEDKHGSVFWANRAVFSKATCLFRFRVIPNINITIKNNILCGDRIYNILSVENIRGRNMYIEVLCEEIKPK